MEGPKTDIRVSIEQFDPPDKDVVGSYGLGVGGDAQHGDVDRGKLRTSEALRIDGLTPESKSCIAFYIVASASRELNLGSDILICIINFQFGCNLVGEEEERVWLAWGVARFLGCDVRRDSIPL